MRTYRKDKEMKEFKVKIAKGRTLYVVNVTHKTLGFNETDCCMYFPKHTAKKLKRRIIKRIKNEQYRKEYEL